MMYAELIDRKIGQVHELRDAAIRGVEKAYLTGDTELFERTSTAFDVSNGVIEGLSELRGKEHIAQALGDLVKKVNYSSMLMEEAAIIEAYPEGPEEADPEELNQEAAGLAS